MEKSVEDIKLLDKFPLMKMGLQRRVKTTSVIHIFDNFRSIYKIQMLKGQCHDMSPIRTVLQICCYLWKTCVHKYCTFEWSDLAVFCDFRKATRFCWSGFTFRRSIPKNQQISLHASASSAAKFSFSKNCRDLKIEKKNFPSL